MLIPLAMAAHITVAAVPDCSVDLFLVANNPSVMRDINWVEKPGENESVEPILRPKLKALDEAGASYVVMDGADSSLFRPKQHEVRYFTRTFSAFGPKMEYLNPETTLGGIHTEPINKNGYVAQTFMYFKRVANSEVAVALQDVNSYRNAVKTKDEQDRKFLADTLLISSDSIGATEKYLSDGKYEFNGVCISQWGIPDPNNPNFIAFPPEGRVSHYKLSRTNGVWGVRLVEYLSQP